MREDWDSSWIEDKTFKPFREQTEWELRGLESADIGMYVFVFGVEVMDEGVANRRYRTRTDMCMRFLAQTVHTVD